MLVHKFLLGCLLVVSFGGINMIRTSSALSDKTATRPPAAPLAPLSTTRPSFQALVGERTGTNFSEIATLKSLPLETERIGPDEVLIKVVFAGVNGGCETFRARGEYAFRGNTQFNTNTNENKDDTNDTDAGTNNYYRLGAEGVGIIEAIGADVAAITNNTIRVGQAVCFVGSAFSEYTTSKAMMVWPIPDPHGGQEEAEEKDDNTGEDATTQRRDRVLAEYVGLRISALTACAMLEKTGKIRQGETVLITAAAGGAGHFAVQFAKLAGCTVIGTVGSDEKARALQSLEYGCDHVINYNQVEDLGQEIKRIAPEGVDVVFEGVGGHMMQIALDVMKPQPSSRLLQVGYISEYPHTYTDADTDTDTDTSNSNAIDCADLFWNSKTITRPDGSIIYGNAWPKNDPAAIGDCKDRILQLYQDGKLQSFVDSGSYQFHGGLASVADAVEYMLSGTAIGKVVVKITK